MFPQKQRAAVLDAQGLKQSRPVLKTLAQNRDLQSVHGSKATIAPRNEALSLRWRVVFERPQQSLPLVQGFLIFARRIGVVDDAPTHRKDKASLCNRGGANGDGEIHRIVKAHVANAARVDVTTD